VSDHQRQRVYRAEWALQDRAIRLPDVAHAQALVAIIERLDFIKPEQKGVVVSTHLGVERAFYREGTIHLPAVASSDRRGEWALTDITLAHEYAHHLAPGRAHDEVFTYFVLRILDGIGRGPLAESLRESYIQHGVAVYQHKIGAGA
jgi:hypothetical protein